MSDKSIRITEAQIRDRIDEMCAESLSPDVYDMWKDQIIPMLNRIRDGLKKKKIGMYGDMPRVQVGKFSICEQTDPPSDTIWIEEDGGEGGEFQKAAFEKTLSDFYNTNF